MMRYTRSFLSRTANDENRSNVPSVLVHLHVYYVEQLGSFLQKLAPLRSSANIHLIVTVSESIESHIEIDSAIRKVFADADVIRTPDIGFDVGPFISVINTTDIGHYDFILKLHTKGRGRSLNHKLNSLVTNDNIWDAALIESLIGSRRKFETAIELIKQEQVGMVASDLCLVVDEDERREYYEDRVNTELAKMGLEQIHDLRFVAGTMFLAKPQLFSPLNKYDLNSFGKSVRGVNDFTFAHTCERLLSAVIVAQGFEIRGLPMRHKHLQALATTWLYENKKQLSRLKRRLRFEFRGKSVIATSPFFDRKWYASSNPGLGKRNPVSHYLKQGFKEGRNPSPLFFNDAYYFMNPIAKNKGYNPLLHFECYGRKKQLSTAVLAIEPTEQIRIIKQSELFDANWYIANNPDVKHASIDPAEHYLLYGGMANRDPSQLFCSAEYYALNPDVRLVGINPLLHYELWGKAEKRKIKCRLRKAAPNIEPELLSKPNKYQINQMRRLCILAFENWKDANAEQMSEFFSLLSDMTDSIILVCGDKPDSSLLEKLNTIVPWIVFEGSRTSRFGLYGRGMSIARNLGLFDSDTIEELLFVDATNSQRLLTSIDTLYQTHDRQCDFWSYGYVGELKWCLRSDCIVFGKRVVDSQLLDEFFYRVPADADDVVTAELEMRLSEILQREGMTSGTASSHREIDLSYAGQSAGIDRAASPLRTLADETRSTPNRITPRNILRQGIPQILQRIKTRIDEGKPIRVLYLVHDSAMFPSRSLFEAMLHDTRFEASLAVIPDMRWPKRIKTTMSKCKADLQSLYGNDHVINVTCDNFGRWTDIASEIDLVCFPTPYLHAYYFMHSFRAVLERGALPFMANYGYYRSLYDRTLMGFESYAYCWMVLVECQANMIEFRENSVLQGLNTELVGYVKMDQLAQHYATHKTRPRILIALHHSVEGGFNDSLSLANFVRYHDYFIELPKRHPSIDFVYRPHPALFESLKKAQNWTDEKVNRFVSKLQSEPNVIWSDGGDYFQEFTDSDACIQDCGSFLVEYFYTGKPCCYMLKSPDDIDAKFAPLGKECLEQCYISYDTGAIDRFIENVVIGGNDPKADGRAALAEKIMVNYPHAAEAALNRIVELVLGYDNCADAKPTFMNKES